MGCNCEPKKYSVSMGCCQPVLAPIENYYTKYEIDEIVEGLEISGGCCITEEEVDNKIESAKTEIENEIPSLSGYATEQWVLDKHYISGVDLSNYALKSEIPTVPTKASAFENDVPYLTEHQSLSGYATEAFVSAYTYDKATIDEKVASGGTFDPTNYYNKTEVNNIVNSAKTEVENEIPSLNGYATEQWVLDKHYISGVDLSDYALKSEIPVVPTSNTAFTNDAGYLTEHQPLKTINGESLVGEGDIVITGGSGITSGEVQTMINNATSGLQETLTAGTNVQIQNNVISATDTTYSAGDNITISNQNVISTVTKFWCGTEAQWGEISGNTDANTIYLIH